ncbi:MAG TPA: cupin domain-containing protein [Steroidobacteraceae bacterium]|nr:cupin domain-containing protein [Steroidobacteraceae bacterium]HUI62498.1 cupin domain-containing protein [Steroidobacteraceae bacterium]
MTRIPRRVVTGHDAAGKSVVLEDSSPPQHHPMHGATVGADFFEMWNVPSAVPQLTAAEAREPNEREFSIMPPAGHLLRLIDIYPASRGGKRTVMHRTRTLDYVVVIEGEVTLILEDSEVLLGKADVVVQRGTNHAWENRSEQTARLAFFHIDALFSPALLARLPQPLELLR